MVTWQKLRRERRGLGRILLCAQGTWQKLPGERRGLGRNQHESAGDFAENSRATQGTWHNFSGCAGGLGINERRVHLLSGIFIIHLLLQPYFRNIIKFHSSNSRIGLSAVCFIPVPPLSRDHLGDYGVGLCSDKHPLL